MKRIVGAFFIAAVLFYLSFLAGEYISSSCQEMKSSLELCAEKIKLTDYEQAKELSLEIKTQWEEKSDVLSLVLGDSTLSAPSVNIAALYRSISDENYSAALELIRECQGCFEELISSQKLSLGNIL